MKRSFFVLAAAAVGAMALPVHANSLDATNWQEKSFSPGNSETTTAFTPTQSGGSVVGTVPTDATEYAYSGNGATGFNAIEHLNAFKGPLVGNLSGKSGFSATFSLYDDNIGSGDTFTTSDFGGQEDGSNNPKDQILLYLRSDTVTDPGNPVSEWWYSPTAVNVTSMTNGGSSSASAAFSDLSHWTDINGQAANSTPAEAVVFEDTLKSVSQIGISFGSGNFYSDGFGFNSTIGGNGTATVSSLTLVPLPKTAWGGLALMGGLGLVQLKKRARQQVA